MEDKKKRWTSVLHDIKVDPKRTDSENRFDDVSLIFFFFSSFQADAMEFKDDVDDIYTRQLWAKL